MNADYLAEAGFMRKEGTKKRLAWRAAPLYTTPKLLCQLVAEASPYTKPIGRLAERLSSSRSLR